MEHFIFPAHTTSLPIVGMSERFPVRRVYCIGLNYVDHAKEMGIPADKIGTGEPLFFGKPADAVVVGPTIRFPPRTSNFHYEAELVVAIGKAGSNVSAAQAVSMIYGYAVGIDLTRRDMQKAAMDNGLPWDFAKGFDESAPCGPILPMTETLLRRGKIELTVNGCVRQSSNLSKLITPIDQMIAILSTAVALKPGDLIFTGTPEGVGKLEVGDVVVASVEGVGSLTVTVLPPAKL